MWLKIKNIFSKKPSTIAVKLTALYASILFCILFFFSVLTVGGMSLLLNRQAEQDIDTSINNVLTYLSQNQTPGPQMLQPGFLLNNVSLRVFDSGQQLVLESAPYAPGDREFHLQAQRPPREHGDWYKHSDPAGPEFSILNENSDAADTFVKQVPWTGDQLYYLEFRKDISEQHRFLHFLTWSFVAFNLLGLLIAVLSGNYLSRKILGPIGDITNAAKNIEIQNLDQRIEVNGSDDELKELAITFNHMLDRIQSGFDQQRRFISDASHELRTPLTVVTGYVNMLDRWGKEDPLALTEGIQAIKSEAANMQSLISKLLFLARTDKGQQPVHKKPVRINLLLEEVVRETILIAPDHNILFDKNDDVTLQLDDALIKQMLRVFIDNSLKYTPPGGSIVISSEHHKDHLTISIKDTGIGIPKQDLPKIFDRFYRVDKSRTKTTGGSGLGLSIACWIAKQHQCLIDVESNPGEGTTVKLIIPGSDSDTP